MTPRQRHALNGAARHSAGQRGSAMIVVVVYLAIMTTFASAFFVALHRTIDQTGRRERQEMCMHIAEGGIEKAIAELQHNAEAYSGERDTSLGEGVFTTEIEVLNPFTEYRITASAWLRDSMAKGSRATLVANVRFSNHQNTCRVKWIELTHE